MVQQLPSCVIWEAFLTLVLEHCLLSLLRAHMLSNSSALRSCPFFHGMLVRHARQASCYEEWLGCNIPLQLLVPACGLTCFSHVYA